MSECPSDKDKHIDPLCCAAGMCAIEEEEMDRAKLDVDGNCGFALLGENLQEGEAEFEEIATKEPVGTIEWTRQAKLAINRAFTRLKARIDCPISYYIGDSHPDHC